MVDNGIDRPFFESVIPDRDRKRILFLGSLEWRPNLDALNLLLDRIFPSVRLAEPSASLDVVGRKGKPWEVEVQVIAVGDDTAWVSLPGEIFVELGLRIKQDSPFRNTIIAELANGSIGYVPSRRAYAQGNYEVVSARCAAGSGERLTDAAIKLLNDLKRSRAASRDKTD